MASTAQERLIEPGRLEDAELEVDDLLPIELEVHSALAFDPREVVDADLA